MYASNVEMVLLRLQFNVNVVCLSNYSTGIQGFSADAFCAKHLKMFVPFGAAPNTITIFHHTYLQPATPESTQQSKPAQPLRCAMTDVASQRPSAYRNSTSG